MAADKRTFAAGRFQLEIANFNVGYLKKFSGLGLEADIAANDLGPDNMQKKYVTNRKWTAGKASVGIGMGKGMYDWINLSFKYGSEYRAGAFTSADFDNKAQSRAEFQQALITGVTVPKLDGASKDAAYFDVEFEPEIVKWVPGKGEKISAPIGKKQKAWMCSMFEVGVGSLPCDRITSVDSFTWKCGIAPDPVGKINQYTKHPTKVTVPDLKFTISHADHDAWADAARKFIIDGHSEEDDEMTGHISFLGPKSASESAPALGTISLMHLGFKKFSHEDVEANSEKIKRFTVELYCEGMGFEMPYTDQ